MLKYGNKDFRNIQEQVAKNMNDIDWLINYKGALNEFGIKVVGQGPLFESGTPAASSYNPGDVICAYAEGLGENVVYTCYYDEEAEENYWSTSISYYKEYHEGWEYGDAWIFGSEAPYEMFILTRSNGSNPTDYFLPVGEFPIPGPQGEQGNQGPVGNTPNVAMTIGSVSTLNAGQNATASISKSGTLAEPVFTLSFAIPQGAKGNTGNVGPQGPQGVQGPKGDKGDKGEQGGLIDVVGIVATAAELPDPETLEKLDAAYLVGTSPDYELYIQVGSTPATAVWTNLGAFNVGSVVEENGAGVPVWNADTKVSVYTNQLVNTIYAEKAGDYQGQLHLPYGTAASANLIVQRDSSGLILVPETPVVDGNATSKKYVDDKIAAQNPLQYKGDLIIGDTGGVPERLALGSAGQVLTVNSSGNWLEYATINAVPSYQSTDNDKFLKVNSTGTGLEWSASSGSAPANMATTDTEQVITAKKTLRTDSNKPLVITNSSDSYRYNIYMASNSSSGQLQFTHNNSITSPTIVFNIEPGGSSTSNFGNVGIPGGIATLNIRSNRDTPGPLGLGNNYAKCMTLRNGVMGSSNSGRIFLGYIGANIDANGINSNPYSNCALNGLYLDCPNDGTPTNNVPVFLRHIPTSDPGIYGQVWNDNGVLKISSGS